MKPTPTIPNSKPRNFVAKNALGSGAGKHKDKKKAEKQGDLKHKNRDKEYAEGRFIKGAGGVPLDRYGNPKIKPSKEMKIRPDPRVPTYSLDTIYNKAASIISQIYPDGDPVDWLGPWCRKNSIPYEMVDKAFQKHGYKDIQAYWNDMDDLPRTMENYSRKLQKSLTKEMKDPTKKKFTDMEMAMMEGGHSIDPTPLRKKKIKESYIDFLHNVLQETINKKPNR